MVLFLFSRETNRGLICSNFLVQVWAHTWWRIGGEFVRTGLWKRCRWESSDAGGGLS